MTGRWSESRMSALVYLATSSWKKALGNIHTHKKMHFIRQSPCERVRELAPLWKRGSAPSQYSIRPRRHPLLLRRIEVIRAGVVFVGGLENDWSSEDSVE